MLGERERLGIRVRNDLAAVRRKYVIERKGIIAVE